MQPTSIRRHILDLTSAKIKPWECLGAQDECKLALALVIERYPDKSFKEAPYLSDLEATLSGFDVSKARRELLEKSCSAYLIPDHLAEKLNGALGLLNEPRIG
jgi:UDP-N-acetyl-alpha-D-muramoyl-L-alanyl-L-glutamate epimerase